ncbi:2-oxo-4-hydroxy-4-carboxy-5-ureidoimidazoline decarboxylase [Aliiglaciecola litoralis]|uniref:2-oxo-4-hydroxy-4-carboxy-5-ureidoimidazoline decarboxylase n=1 Tax=Aliiglaciecola litoralis TaxID=582857 RepID=A0ABN1LCD3_9ALTE
MKLEQLNQLDDASAQDWFSKCCAASQWTHMMSAKRPYSSVEQIEDYTRKIWPDLTEKDYRQAFEAHPMIGDINSLKKKFASTSGLAQQEQSGAVGAEPSVLQRLSQLNHEYLAKNGFIFIICATGLSAQQMLTELELRIANSTEQEIAIAAGQQLKITLLRIRKNLAS